MFVGLTPVQVFPLTLRPALEQAAKMENNHNQHTSLNGTTKIQRTCFGNPNIDSNNRFISASLVADDGNEGEREGRGREGRRRESWEREGGQEDMKERVLGEGGRSEEETSGRGGQKESVLGEGGRAEEESSG